MQERLNLQQLEVILETLDSHAARPKQRFWGRRKGEPFVNAGVLGRVLVNLPDQKRLSLVLDALQNHVVQANPWYCVPTLKRITSSWVEPTFFPIICLLVVPGLGQDPRLPSCLALGKTHANKQTNKQTSKQANKQANKQTNKHANKQKYKQTKRQTNTFCAGTTVNGD